MDNLLTVWQKAQEGLKNRLGNTVFETWIMPLKVEARGKEALSLQAPDAFFKDWVEQHYRLALSQELPNIEIHIEANGTQEPMKDARPQNTKAAPLDIKHQLNLNPRYTFDNFVEGSSNKHALAYCLAVANAPAKSYNPLFVYGASGLGKTHLIQAVCHQIWKQAEGKVKICYMPSERFTNELIDAIQHHSTAAFRQKYRNLDVLVIDDIHFFGGKESTQEEFFHTFNALYDAHKQIILCSDRPPKEITNLQDRLVSRFNWGLTTDIQPPDLETRVAILKKKVERESVNIPNEVIFFIAQLIKTNIRELEGALVRTIAYALMEEKPITLELAQEVLRDLLKEPKKLITVDFIQRCVAEEYGLTLPDLKTRRRNKTVVLPRQVAMYLSRELTDLSLPEIGTQFGGKDHTTVLHSYNKIKEEVSKNTELRDRVERVAKLIKQ